MGASVVNALSTRLDVEVDRNSAVWGGMSFKHGIPGVFDGPGPDAGFTPGGQLTKLRKAQRGWSGTRVRYWPDRQIFLPDAELSMDALTARARQTSFLVPGAGHRDPRRTRRRTGGRGAPAPGGNFRVLRVPGPPDEAITEVIRLQGSDSFTETVPMLDESGSLTPTDVERELGGRHCAALGARATTR